MSISKITSSVWPVSPVVPTGEMDGDAQQDSERKRPEHQRIAEGYSKTLVEMAQAPLPHTLAFAITAGSPVTISEEGSALLAAEEAGAKITWDPLHPAIAHYLDVGPKR
jgi:hypothetical protein